MQLEGREALLNENVSAVVPMLSIQGYNSVNFQQPIDAECALDTTKFDVIKGKPLRIMHSPFLRESCTLIVFIQIMDKSLGKKAVYSTSSALGNTLSFKVVCDVNSPKGFAFAHLETQGAADKVFGRQTANSPMTFQCL